MQQLIEIGANEAFTDEESSVICYKGENYYLACGAAVAGDPDTGSTSCVKRKGHQGVVHQDYDGKVAVDTAEEREKQRVVIVVSFDQPDSYVELMMKVSKTKHAFQDELNAGGVKVFMGINDVAESVLTIFDDLSKEPKEEADG